MIEVMMADDISDECFCVGTDPGEWRKYCKESADYYDRQQPQEDAGDANFSRKDARDKISKMIGGAETYNYSQYKA